MTSSILLGKSGAADGKSVDVVLQARYGNRHGKRQRFLSRWQHSYG